MIQTNSTADGKTEYVFFATTVSPEEASEPGGKGNAVTKIVHSNTKLLLLRKYFEMYINTTLTQKLSPINLYLSVEAAVA